MPALPAHFDRRHLSVGVAGGAALLAVGLVDPSRHRLGPPCPLRALTGLDCPLCGSTRATHSLWQGDLAGALDYNALYVLGLPLVALAVASWMLLGRRPAWLDRPWLTWGVLAVAVTFALLRNLPIGPFTVLSSTAGTQ